VFPEALGAGAAGGLACRERLDAGSAWGFAIRAKEVQAHGNFSRHHPEGLSDQSDVRSGRNDPFRGGRPMRLAVTEWCDDPDAPYYQLTDIELDYVVVALGERVRLLVAQVNRRVAAGEGMVESGDELDKVSRLRARLNPCGTKCYPPRSRWREFLRGLLHEWAQVLLRLQRRLDLTSRAG
jgi:hypothetical protein